MPQRRDFDRRSMLKLLAAGSTATLWPAARARAGAAPYRVGVGQVPDPYDATVRAIDASGEWPDVLGKHVIIKPNLVSGKSADEGVTTDRRVVQAMVDRALADGATKVTIIEGLDISKIISTGYDAFLNYDPRVTMEQTESWPRLLVPVPGGSAYKDLILPEGLFDADVVFMSAAKLKTHGNARATLSMKNLFGLPPREPYTDEVTQSNGRYGMHARSVPLTVVDLNLARPVDFAVIDGIIGMEGPGPTNGDPVRMDVVLAGRNAVAVDRIGVEVMEIPQGIVRHLWLASLAGLGPADVSEIDVVGDPLPTRKFLLSTFSVEVLILGAPDVFDSGGGTTASIQWAQDRRRPSVVEIVHVDDAIPWDFTRVARVKARTWYDRGLHSVTWDGRDNAGTLVPPGLYAIRVVVDDEWFPRPAYAFKWIQVV